MCGLLLIPWDIFYMPKMLNLGYEKSQNTCYDTTKQPNRIEVDF
jgi:hypothetical protein